MLQANRISNQPISHPLLDKQGVSLCIKRLDQVHEAVPGNKFFKLKYNLLQAALEGKTCLLTFGGAYSNHIHAVSGAAHLLGWKSVGIIRGEESLPLNPTLSEALEKGMTLYYCDRNRYRQKETPEFLLELRQTFGDFFLIPEGGTNKAAIRGAAEILDATDNSFTHLATSIGTGGTFSGLLKAALPHQVLCGFSALKGEFIHQELAQQLRRFQIQPKANYQVFTEYHCGGYAKVDQKLVEFMWWFQETFGITLDPIYTAKLFWGIWDLLQKGFFPEGSKILALHSGGLQGIKGYELRTGITLPDPSA